MALKATKIGMSVSIMIAATAGLTPAADAASRTTEIHCVQQVAGPGVSVAPAPHCFGTYREAVAYLTGGRVELSPALGSEPDGSGTTAVDAQIARGLIANTTHVISTEYTDSGYSGSTYTFTWTSDCTGIDIAWSSMPSGFDNTISSSHTGTNCTAIHYDNTGATPSTPPSGASISCATYSSCSSLGTMNDKTSSMRWTP
jgi:hypothetical protein